MTLEEAEDKYGTIQGYIDNLKELLGLGDMRVCDVETTLMDINFIRGEAGLGAMDEVQLAECLV